MVSTPAIEARGESSIATAECFSLRPSDERTRRSFGPGRRRRGTEDVVSPSRLAGARCARVSGPIVGHHALAAQPSGAARPRGPLRRAALPNGVPVPRLCRRCHGDRGRATVAWRDVGGGGSSSADRALMAPVSNRAPPLFAHTHRRTRALALPPTRTCDGTSAPGPMPRRRHIGHGATTAHGQDKKVPDRTTGTASASSTGDDGLESLSYRELQQRCKRAGLKAAGTALELRRRLRATSSAGAASDAADAFCVGHACRLPHEARGADEAAWGIVALIGGRPHVIVPASAIAHGADPRSVTATDGVSVVPLSLALRTAAPVGLRDNLLCPACVAANGASPAPDAVAQTPLPLLIPEHRQSQFKSRGERRLSAGRRRRTDAISESQKAMRYRKIALLRHADAVDGCTPTASCSGDRSRYSPVQRPRPPAAPEPPASVPAKLAAAKENHRWVGPASPQVRRERGEMLLPPKLLTPYLPSPKIWTPAHEDLRTARIVDHIMRTTRPGSIGERVRVMQPSSDSPVRHSPPRPPPPPPPSSSSLSAANVSRIVWGPVP